MNASSGPLPNFFVVGTAKCATTSLARFFEQHPDVCFCQVHEPNFFALDSEYAKGLDTYRTLYSHYAGETAIGEKSWRYSCARTYPEALPRILSAIPKFKALYVVRDPLPRAISFWRELRDGGQDRIAADINLALREENIITDSSRYATQLSLFEDALGPDNVKTVLFEDFVADAPTFYYQICDFLGIAHFVPEETIHANKSVAQRSDSRTMEAIRSAGLDEPLRRMSPEPLRKLARNFLKRPVGEIAISEETRQAFLDLVGEDCGRLLDRMGRDRSLWNLK